MTYNWDYERYQHFLVENADDKDTLARLLGTQKLYFHTSLSNSPKQFLQNAQAAHEAASDPVVRYFDGSTLVVETTTSAPGYLAWMDNWDEGWSAKLDEAPARVELLLGSFKTVHLAKPGKHTVSFRYRPAISIGAYLACALGILLIGVLPLWKRRPRIKPPSIPLSTSPEPA